MKRILSLALLAGWLMPSVSMAAALSGDDLLIVQAAEDVTSPGAGNPTCSASIGNTTAANFFDNTVAPGNAGRWISTQHAYKTSPYVYATYTFGSPTVVDAYSVQILDDAGYAPLGRAPKTMHFYGTNDDLDGTPTWTLLDVTDGGETAIWSKGSEIQYFRVNQNRTAFKTYKWESTEPQNVADGGDGLTAGGQGYIQLSELQFFSAFGEDVAFYDVEIVESVGGTVSAANRVLAGESIVIVAMPDAAHNYVFTGWDVSGGAIGDANAATTTFTPTADGATIRAVFTRLAAELTLESLGGGTVTASATTVEPDASVTLTATPGEGFRFLCWMVSNGTVENPASPTTSYTPDANGSVTALFVPVDSCLTFYVSAEKGNDANDGFSEETPKKTIKSALDYMASVLDNFDDTKKGVIYVLKGTYNETNIEVANPVRILGMTGNPEDVVITYSFSFGKDQAIFKMFHKDAVVANLTIENITGYQEANPYSDASCHAYAVDLESGGTLSNCVIRASKTSHPFRRGAVQLRSSDARVTRCLFFDNYGNAGNSEWINGGYYQASTIYMKAGLVDNCVFKGNRSVVSTSHCPVVATVHMYGGVLVNCSFFENHGSLCGGVSVNNASARVINTAFYKNAITENSMDHESIEYGNYRGNENCFVNCAADEETMLGEGGIANLTAAAFKDYANGKYVPAFGGVLCNAGTTNGVPASALVLDFAGKPRIQGSKIDIGAYEAPPGGLRILIR